MKVLVCVLGQMRMENITWTPFKRNVLDALNADMVTCGPDPDIPGKFQDNSILKLKSDPDVGSESKVPNVCRTLGHRKNLYTGLVESGLIEQYDQFVITRSDLMWYGPHPPLDNNHIWFMNTEFHFGIADRHTVVPRRFLSDILVFDDPFDSFKYVNMESYLLQQYIKKGIWGQDVALSPFPMYLTDEKGQARRPDELLASRVTCFWPFKIIHNELSPSGMYTGRALPEGQHIDGPPYQPNNLILNIP